VTVKPGEVQGLKEAVKSSGELGGVLRIVKEHGRHPLILVELPEDSLSFLRSLPQVYDVEINHVVTASRQVIFLC